MENEAGVFEVPEDLTVLTDDEVSALATQVDTRGQELAAQPELTDDEVVEAEALAAVKVEFATERTRRASLASEKAARAAAALAAFATAEPETPEEAPAEDAPAEEAAPEADPAEAAAATETLAVSTRRSYQGASPAFIQSKAAKVTQSAPPAPEKGEFMSATAFSRDAEGTVYDSPADVARAIWEKQMKFGIIPAGVSEKLSIATGFKTFEADQPVLGLDHEKNMVAMREVATALVASGTCCTPQNQLYDFFRLSEPIVDVENAIPTVQAPRGGIRYIAANCSFAGAAGAVGFTDCDDLEDEDYEKPCARVSCPTIGEELVQSISVCTIFDNLQYRTFPELIENFQEDVAVQFALKKQRFYLDNIDAASTATTGIGAYGAARSMMYDLQVAAVAYRKRHHMPRGARLQALIPDWALDVIKADMFYDGDQGLNFLNVPDAAVIEGLRSRGLDPTFYYDERSSIVLAGTNPLILPQAAGPLNDFPDVASSYIFAPGTFVKLDGGTLDVGLVRDHALNKRNDFAMFMEEWLGFAQLGCESIRVDSTVCANGSRPALAAIRACTGG